MDSLKKSNRKKLGDLLIEAGIVKADELPKGLEYAQKATDADVEAVEKLKVLVANEGLTVPLALRAINLAKQKRYQVEQALMDLGWRPGQHAEVQQARAAGAADFLTTSIDRIQAMQSTEMQSSFDRSELDAIGMKPNAAAPAQRPEAGLLAQKNANAAAAAAGFDKSQLDAIGRKGGLIGSKKAAEQTGNQPLSTPSTFNAAELDAIGTKPNNGNGGHAEAAFTPEMLDAIGRKDAAEPAAPPPLPFSSDQLDAIGRKDQPSKDKISAFNPAELDAIGRKDQPSSDKISAFNPADLDAIGRKDQPSKDKISAFNPADLDAIGRKDQPSKDKISAFNPAELDSIGRKDQPSKDKISAFNPAELDSIGRKDQPSVDKISAFNPAELDAIGRKDAPAQAASSFNTSDLDAIGRDIERSAQQYQKPQFESVPAVDPLDKIARDIERAAQQFQAPSFGDSSATPPPLPTPSSGEAVTPPPLPAESGAEAVTPPPLPAESGAEAATPPPLPATSGAGPATPPPLPPQAPPDSAAAQADAAAEPRVMQNPRRSWWNLRPVSAVSGSSHPKQDEMEQEQENLRKSWWNLKAVSSIESERAEEEPPPPTAEELAQQAALEEERKRDEARKSWWNIKALPSNGASGAVPLIPAQQSSPPSASSAAQSAAAQPEPAPAVRDPKDYPQIVAEAQKAFEEFNYELSESLYMVALELLETNPESTLAEVSELLIKLGCASMKTKQFTRSEKYFTRALKIREKNAGEKDLSVAEVMDHLAELFEVQSQYSEAEQLYMTALGIKEQSLSAGSQDIAASLKKLVAVAKQKGPNTEEKLSGQLLEEAGILDSKTVEDGLSIANEQGIPIGRALVSLNKLTEDDLQAVLHAQLLIREGVVPGFIAVRALRLRSQLGLSFEDALKQIGLEPTDAEGAEVYKLLRAAQQLVDEERRLAADHPDVGRLCLQLGDLYFEHARYKQAQQLYARTHAIFVKLETKEPKQIAEVLTRQANTLYALGQYADAEVVCLELLDLFDHESDKKDSTYIAAVESMAAAKYMLGDFKDSGRLYQMSVNSKEEAFGQKHPMLIPALQGRANCYYAQERFDEAEHLYRRAIDIGESVYGKNSEQIAGVASVLGDLLFTQRKFDKAQAEYLHSLDALSNAVNPDLWLFCVVLEKLARCCLELQDFVRADNYYRHFIKTRQSCGTDRAADMADAFDNWAIVLEKLGRKDEAAVSRQKAQTTRAAAAK